MKQLRSTFNLITLFLIITVLIAYSYLHHPKHDALKTCLVNVEPMHNVIYFTGTIQPLHESTLTSPMEAVVETLHFHYGQSVKKGDVVMTLNSHELQKQYNDTLTDYLKAKEGYTIAHTKFIGTQELWDAGLLSKNNYLNEKSSLNTARITLIQSKRRLTEVLEKVNESTWQDLISLNMAEFNKVKQALTAKHNLIYLRAASDGVLLYPPKPIEEKTNKLAVGSAVKAGQVLALVGDLTGISVEIDIPEIDIDKVHPGMKATLTGVALGQQTLHGELVAVNAQASNTGNGSLPSFSAVIEIKPLTVEQQAHIKVGMSASIALAIEGNNQLLIPIRALKQKNGNTIVQIQDSSDKLSTRIVSTGPALADKVAIVSGLNAGEVILCD